MVCTVLIVTGPPAAGKTTLSRKLAKELNLPLIVKDDIKDKLFDVLGWKDRDWSRKLGGASFEILFQILESLLQAQTSCIVETAFHQVSAPTFLALKDRYGFHPIQIVCTASPDLLFQRFKQRSESGERHPGHVDGNATYDQFQTLLKNSTYATLEIGGTIIEIDTTNFDRIDYKGLYTSLHTALKNS